MQSAQKVHLIDDVEVAHTRGRVVKVNVVGVAREHNLYETHDESLHPTL